MPIDPSIPLGVQTPKFQSPFESMGRLMQFRGMQQQQEANRLIMADNRLDIAKKDRERRDVNALDEAITPGSSLDDILSRLPGHMHATVRKQYQEAEENAQKAKSAKLAAAEAQADYFGNLGSVAKHWKYDPQTVSILMQHAEAQGHDTTQIKALLQQDPAKLPVLIDGLIDASPKYRALRNTEAGQAEAARNNLADNTRADLAQTETGRHNLISEGLSATGQKEAARSNRVSEGQRAQGLGLERQRIQNEAASVPTFTPEALDVVAHQFAMTGQLPPMGMGKAAASSRSQIINRAAEIYKGLDIPSQQAAFASNKASLVKMQGQRDAISAFEETALKNLDVFIGTAKKVADTGSPFLNRPLRSFNERQLGSPEMAAYNTARRTVIPEFARILSNPTLTGVLSDSARNEVEELLKGDATMAQTLAVANILRQDTTNRKQSLDDGIKGIQQRLAAGPTLKPQTGSGGTVQMKAPDGRIVSIPANQVDEAKRRGATMVGG